MSTTKNSNDTISTEEIKAELEKKIRAELETEIKEKEQQLREQLQAELEAQKKPEPKKVENHNEERVPFVLQKPHYIKADTHANVTVNGVVYRVKYGEEVYIPRFVKEAIENSMQAKAILTNKQTELLKRTEAAMAAGAL